MSAPAFTPCGFWGQTFTAEGRSIRVEPKEVHEEDGWTNVTLGFPFATLEEYVGPPSIASDLAEYLSCPKRAVAPELYGQLESAQTDLDLLRRAIEENDPKAELLIRVTDLWKRNEAALARARGEEVAK